MEFNRSDGPSFHNAITAYQAGATGQGITVGVIDSGIDPSSHEFTGRIHPQSGDVTGAGRPLGDDDGHGTEVTRVIAAAKDDRDTHGIAFNATILALRADQAGSCTTPGPGEDEASCSFFNSSNAAGVNHAVDSGARRSAAHCTAALTAALPPTTANSASCMPSIWGQLLQTNCQVSPPQPCHPAGPLIVPLAHSRRRFRTRLKPQIRLHLLCAHDKVIFLRDLQKLCRCRVSSDRTGRIVRIYQHDRPRSRANE